MLTSEVSSSQHVCTRNGLLHVRDVYHWWVRSAPQAACIGLCLRYQDDIYPSPSARDQTAHLGITGGAGTYSAIGARLLSPGPLSRRVGWIVDCGTDFPHELNAVISSWDTGVLMRQRDGLTTKGWNGYGANDYRGSLESDIYRISQGD